MSQGFARGGIVQGGGITITQGGVATFAGTIKAASININASAIKAGQSFSQVAKATKKLQWSLEKYEAVDYCHNRRGGPRSKIHCEVPKTVPHDTHSGRGNTGNWFSWKDREECF